MARNMYNTHLNILLTHGKEHYLMDTYISIVNMSIECNKKFVIQTFTESIPYLTRLVLENVNTTYKTARKCLETLINLNILEYSTDLDSWVIKDMEKMVLSSEGVDPEERALYTGYTRIRPFFFSQSFTSMTSYEKRIIVFMAQKADSLKNIRFDCFKINLLKNRSAWYDILHTKNKYYAKSIINKMLDKYKDLFITKDGFVDDITNKTRRKQLEFSFKFNCEEIEKNNETLSNETMDLVFKQYQPEYEMILDKMAFLGLEENINVQKKDIMHIIKAISHINEWMLKERIAQNILNKIASVEIHKNKENPIKSIASFSAAVAKVVVGTYKEYLKRKELERSFNGLGVDFYDYLDSLKSSLQNNIRKTEKRY